MPPLHTHRLELIWRNCRLSSATGDEPYVAFNLHSTVPVSSHVCLRSYANCLRVIREATLAVQRMK